MKDELTLTRPPSIYKEELATYIKSLRYRTAHLAIMEAEQESDHMVSYCKTRRECMTEIADDLVRIFK